MDIVSHSADPAAQTTPQQPQETPAQPTYDPAAILAEVDSKYVSWRQLKRANEIQWYLNAATVRGLHNVRFNPVFNQLERERVPQHKLRPTINKVIPKYRARKSKYLKNRYTPIVVPASGDREDALNAQASQKALEFVSRQAQLEKVYRKVVDHVCTYGKGFIWTYWDSQALGFIKNDQSGQSHEAPIGDVKLDAGSPFEVLVPDVGVQDVGSQHEVMRVRAIPLSELRLRYKDHPQVLDIKGDTSGNELFTYQKQIATLSTRSNVSELAPASDKSSKELTFVTLKELFTRPCGEYPKGRYVVVGGGVVLRISFELPYKMYTEGNPFPVVEFNDIELADQFWPTSVTEQLIGPQREYSDYRNKIVNHLNKQAHPKIIVSVFSKFPANAWNDEAGEVIKVVTPPGVMEPKVIIPPPISSDIWNALNALNHEIDEISGLPASAVGSPGTATSGFQVSLLQEATDSVHAPDIRGHELAFEELYRKMRKIMKLGYDIPRLIRVAGRANVPDVVEFSGSNIDEHTDIVVYTGSGLSNSPAVRTQQVIELWNAGLLQDDINPAEGKRKALTMLDSQGIGEFQEEKRRDEEKGRLENLKFTRMQPVEPPIPFDDHRMHYNIHTDQMKSPEFDLWQPQQKIQLYVHTLLHMKYINPMEAANTAIALGLPQLVQILLPPQMQAQPAGAIPVAQNQPPSGGVPQAPGQQPQQLPLL